MLDRAQEIHLEKTKKKCQFRVIEVSYVGHLHTSEGVVPDLPKIKAVTKMPAPEDLTALQRLLGMVNYPSKFISNYSKHIALPHTLLHKNTEWC